MCEISVLYLKKQACRDLGVDTAVLRRWMKNIDKIRTLRKKQRKGTLTHPCKFPALENRVQTLILEKRKFGRKFREN
jgi:hypothetical protein